MVHGMMLVQEVDKMEKLEQRLELLIMRSTLSEKGGRSRSILKACSDCESSFAENSHLDVGERGRTSGKGWSCAAVNITSLIES